MYIPCFKLLLIKRLSNNKKIMGTLLPFKNLNTVMTVQNMLVGSCRWVDNIKTDLRERGWGAMGCFGMSQGRG
jgi:hypothetical protein